MTVGGDRCLMGRSHLVALNAENKVLREARRRMPQEYRATGLLPVPARPNRSSRSPERLIGSDCRVGG